MLKTSFAAAALVASLSQGTLAAELPPGVFAGERDATLADAGTYTLDPSHTAVIAKVSHIGYALSVFRFDRVDGTLVWDPAAPAHASLTATVDTGSISTPVPGFAAELAGDGFLKATTFPKATFKSKAARQIDATHGEIDGDFTLMGKTQPLTFAVELTGAGKGFMGHPRLGVQARAKISPGDYGITPVLSAPIQIEIDGEFGRT